MTSQSAANASLASRQSSDSSRRREIASRRRGRFFRSKSASLSTSSDIETTPRDPTVPSDAGAGANGSTRHATEASNSADADDVCGDGAFASASF